MVPFYTRIYRNLEDLRHVVNAKYKKIQTNLLKNRECLKLINVLSVSVDLNKNTQLVKNLHGKMKIKY